MRAAEGLRAAVPVPACPQAGSVQVLLLGLSLRPSASACSKETTGPVWQADCVPPAVTWRTSGAGPRDPGPTRWPAQLELPAALRRPSAVGLGRGAASRSWAGSTHGSASPDTAPLHNPPGRQWRYGPAIRHADKQPSSQPMTNG
jgi:hypothetical protein